MWSTEKTCQLITAIVISFLIALIACKIFDICICFKNNAEGLFPVQNVRVPRTGNTSDIRYPFNVNLRNSG